MSAQDNVFGFIDTITKPLQWAVTAIVDLMWFVLLLLGAVVYPFALVCLGQPTTLLNWAISGLCVLFIFTVFYTPWYTLMGGVLVVIVGSIYILKTHTFYTYTDLLWVLFIFLLFGIVQKTIRVRLKKNNHTPL